MRTRGLKHLVTHLNWKPTIGIMGFKAKDVAYFNEELVKQANARGAKKDQDLMETIGIGIECDTIRQFTDMAEYCSDFGCDFLVSPVKVGSSRLAEIISNHIRIPVIFPAKDQSMSDFAQVVLDKANTVKNIRRPYLRFDEENNPKQHAEILQNLEIDKQERSARMAIRKKEVGPYSFLNNKNFVGVIGGAGPWASASFCKELSDRAVEFVHVSANSAPGKHYFEMGTGPSYIPHYKNTVEFLIESGAKHLAIPCNTASKRLGEFCGEHVDKVIDFRQSVLEQNNSVDGYILIGTNATVGVNTPKDGEGIYEKWRSENMPNSSPFIVPSPDQQKKIMEAIFAIKAGEENEAKVKINTVIEDIRRENNYHFSAILACTELPLVYEKAELVANGYIDPGVAAARKSQEIINHPNPVCSIKKVAQLDSSASRGAEKPGPNQ